MGRARDRCYKGRDYSHQGGGRDARPVPCDRWPVGPRFLFPRVRLPVSTPAQVVPVRSLARELTPGCSRGSPGSAETVYPYLLRLPYASSFRAPPVIRRDLQTEELKVFLPGCLGRGS
ncbi:hypothetical protein NDU88_002714 [Pleurodeles waltl]|uniref:Uncharacterized protein n=1 Tax=Pleurodeles waltl TaxID=8319 RepID=A0AAV7VBC1_PLEWA|nr:hypothetical protein NDU88_002714 [Pleurodeles waltl]